MIDLTQYTTALGVLQHNKVVGYSNEDINDIAKDKSNLAVFAKIENAIKDTFPAPLPLPNELIPVIQFTENLLPNSLKGYCFDTADRMQIPPDYVAIPLMIGLGAVIGRKCGIRPKLKNNWTEAGNLWGMIIGNPGYLKSPAIAEALKPINYIEGIAYKEFETEKSIYETSLKQS